ncbi:tyrosyl-DNA phosphodiesterase [Truncatella angustata]|uniref:Tyrosyl-DNA phosphodiesterase n=1 Tax=Truncatella angustata TaxID=152316 RepID=A0A9P8UTS4_9PEZI|nr:tyrosyl-DNA phosphodiesterase [Truncatella angustata]KAH6659004.1 tyrosyl-DNA phosphodiesterase [Truncatella angustata]
MEEERHEHSKSIPPEPGQPPARETPAKEHPQVEAGHEAAHQKLIPSPFQLTTIRDLPPQSNAGAVSLHDLLGDPLISECWEFNYLHNIEFLMSHFDEDVRALVKIHVVHGNWKREDPSRLALEEEASRHKNITLHTAYMPEPFGTHHSKMLILFRHDDTAQVIIHTANMIAKDWTNMTNAVWQSPSLPLSNTTDHGQPDAAIGTGEKFKADIMSYLRAYNKQRNVCRALVDNLSKYDFSAVRGALIASVPGRHPVNDHPSVTRWGWTAMKHALRCVPVQQGRSEVVVQISSIATLGGTDTWIQKTLFDSLSSSGKSSTKPELKIIFPTPDEISRSLDGYASGGSIHTKIQSAQQQKQLVYLRPVFCHWANDAAAGLPTDGPSSKLGQRDGGRQRAAPHIKTYIRYNSSNTLDWALFTSANISKQAWGEAANGVKEVRIASWEIGVLVWPELLAGGEPGAQMVGVFRKDEPIADDLVKADVQSEGTGGGTTTLVGLRIPYSLPLKKYGPTEKPWVATADYQEPDWKGQRWVSWAV